jgi:hypothetical protein
VKCLVDNAPSICQKCKGQCSENKIPEPLCDCTVVVPGQGLFDACNPASSQPPSQPPMQPPSQPPMQPPSQPPMQPPVTKTAEEVGEEIAIKNGLQDFLVPIIRSKIITPIQFDTLMSIMCTIIKDINKIPDKNFRQEVYKSMDFKNLKSDQTCSDKSFVNNLNSELYDFLEDSGVSTRLLASKPSHSKTNGSGSNRRKDKHLLTIGGIVLGALFFIILVYLILKKK